jgi:hypothetical protein
MKNVMTGQATVAAVAPTLHLGTYRRAIMAVMSADVFTPAERLRANHSVYECEDSAKLALWLKNVRRVFAEREAVLEQADLAELAQVAEAPVRYATAEQTSEIHKLALHRAITLGERTKVLLTLPRLDSPAATALIGELWAKILHRGGTTPTAFLPSAPAPAPRPLPASPPPVVPPTPPSPTCPAPFTDSSTCQAA